MVSLYCIFNTTCENKNLHLVLQIACGILGLETGFLCVYSIFLYSPTKHVEVSNKIFEKCLSTLGDKLEALQRLLYQNLSELGK